MKKNKIKNIATIMTVVLGTGILSTAETLNEGINLGDNTSNAIGSGSLATGRGTNAIGSNAFASGNNMTREQYEEFIKQNNARLKELESKMQEVASARGDLSKLEAEHQDIANKLRTIETYRNQIVEKERQLAEKEPILTREIEVKKGEKVSYRTQIEDLERRLNIIGQLDFSTINDSNRGQAIDVLAQDLKTKMENGVTFLSEYGENGIPVEEYKKAILKQIDTQRKTIISGNFESELYNNRDNIYNTYHDNDQEYRKKLIENDKYTYTDGDADGYRQINNYKKIGDIIYFNQDFYSNITQKFQAEIDRLKALEKDTQDQITIKENEITGYRSDITNLTNLLNGENPGNIDEVARQINEKKELIVNTEREIETLKANVSNVKDGENALANGTNSRALGKASISIGTNNYTNQESSIALGTNNTVNGEKSIAIGYGHNIQGNRNATLGDPNTIYGNDNFVIGNNITIGSEQNPVNNNLVFGSNINIQNVSNAIVLGNGSDAVENAVSVGKTGAERKIVNVADGLISETSKEAINGSQLYKFSLSLDDKLSKINLAPSTPKVDTSLINADIANALAIAGIPQVGGNKLFSLGAGTGYNAGQAAIALGISGQTPNKMFIFKLSGAVNLKKGYSVSAGVNINFGDIEDTTNKKLEREVLELRNKLKDLKVTNVTEVNGKNYDGDITKLENQNKDLVKSNESLLNAIKYLKNELDSLKTQTDTLKKQTTTDKTNIAEQPVIQHITLDNFDFDKYDLKREHLSELGKLDYNTIKNVVIVGHADERGSDEYNQKLSENRAKIVRDFIKDLNNKIDIYYLGKGKSELISTDQAKNRRVEISIK